MELLKCRKKDVEARLEQAEVQHMRPKKEVQLWIKSVNDMESQVNDIVDAVTQQISNRCLSGCCPKKCCSNYKIGKRVAKKLTVVERLSSTGNFSDVADILPPADVEAMPSRPTVGMDLIFEKVWRCLTEYQVGIMGLYGMGGVGKTTLLKKIDTMFRRQRTSDSGLVIWITVSKESNTTRVHKDIGNLLGLSFPKDASQDLRVSLIFNALSKKKFVLLLDDIWDRVDFEVVGIPFPNNENKSKVIFTTRSEELCGRMEAQKKIRVECLGWNEAWYLFQTKVGHEVLHSDPQILGLAKVVARECAGLPLALITIGRTMASKKTTNEWKRAITVLRKYASEITGMEDNVFRLLKFSYDSLSSTVQSCFLYCSLYPEDYDIDKEQLIELWLGEGFLMELDMNEARYQGHDIIETLKLACLLESGKYEDEQVKMHDVIRDMGLWIACECGRKKDKFFVQARIGPNEALEVEKWEDTERISLMHSNIRALTETPMCPNLKTVLLTYNHTLEMISDSFFKFMPGLRVLDLSSTNIRELPMEIVNLVELQYLNLSCTEIKTLPDELENLVKLKYLNWTHTNSLPRIPLKVISRLPILQVLMLYNINYSNYENGLEIDSEENLSSDGLEKLGCWGGASLGELECLKHLKVLDINIKNVPDLLMFFNSKKISRCIRKLCIMGCRGLISLSLSPLSSSSSSATSSTLTLGNINCLYELCFANCLDLEELTVEGKNGFSLSLERLTLFKIRNYNALKDFGCLVAGRSLQTLEIANCKGVEEVISGVLAVEEEFITFSRLKRIWLTNLPNLKSIYRHVLPFPSLELIQIMGCPKLKKFPLDSNSSRNNFKLIGQGSWWDESE